MAAAASHLWLMIIPIIFVAMFPFPFKLYRRFTVRDKIFATIERAGNIFVRKLESHMKIRIIALLIAVSMFIALPAIPCGAEGITFTDVNPSDWFYAYINELVERGLTYGRSDGTYAPNEPLLIDEFLAFTLRALGHNVKLNEAYWAQHYIEEAISKYLLIRTPEDSFTTDFDIDMIKHVWGW
jgi:hypothetical protein